MNLFEYLESMPPGPIAETADLEMLLAECWDDIPGANQQGMSGDKLPGRMEDVVWNPPVLAFVIERHGATVNGSTKAERQKWVLDIVARTASWENVGYRPVRRRQSNLDLRPVAEEIAQLILARKPDQRLKWNENGSVRVLIGEILPEGSAVAQTLAGRRMRFRKKLDQLLLSEGWQKIRPNIYAPPVVRIQTDEGRDV